MYILSMYAWVASFVLICFLTNACVAGPICVEIPAEYQQTFEEQGANGRLNERNSRPIRATKSYDGRADLTAEPFTHIGLLWGVFQCTAQYAGHPGVVMTAAHCVFDHRSNTTNFDYQWYPGISVNHSPSPLDGDRELKFTHACYWSEYVREVLQLTDEELAEDALAPTIAPYDYAFLVTRKDHVSEKGFAELLYQQDHFRAPKAAVAAGYSAITRFGTGTPAKRVTTIMQDPQHSGVMLASNKIIGPGASGAGIYVKGDADKWFLTSILSSVNASNSMGAAFTPCTRELHRRAVALFGTT